MKREGSITEVLRATAVLFDRLSAWVAENTLQLQLRRRRANGFRFWAEIPGKPIQELTTMSLILKDDQKVKLSILPVDAKGNPAAVDGVPVWASSDDGVIAVIPSADGLSATATAVGKVGTAQVSVTADADLGDGVSNIAGVLDVTVVAGQAVSVGVTAGTPEAQ